MYFLFLYIPVLFSHARTLCSWLPTFWEDDRVNERNTGRIRVSDQPFQIAWNSGFSIWETFRAERWIDGPLWLTVC